MIGIIGKQIVGCNGITQFIIQGHYLGLRFTGRNTGLGGP